jgi:hypothetical protein
MLRDISESDWKLFRQLQPVALERFCQRVLSEIGPLVSDTRKTSHQRYLAVFRLLHRRDTELAVAFNDPRRSRALQQLARIQSHHLLTEEEMSRFSADTCEIVELLLGTSRG